MKKILQNNIPFFFLVATWGIFLWYMISQLFFLTKEGTITTFIWPVSGDWGMHLAQVQAFAHHSFFEVMFHNPLYSGSVTAYPVLINFFSGKILQLTGNLEFSMLFPLYVLTPFLLWGLYLLGYQITKNKWASVLGIFIIFLGGGIVHFLNTAAFESLNGFEQNIFLESHGQYWKSFFVTLLFPQRALFLGLAVGSFLLWIFLKYREKKFQNVSWWKLLLLGGMVGLLAIIHTHSFLFFALFGGFFALLDWKYFPKYLLILFGASLTALPFLWLIFQGENDFEFLYHSRWMEAQHPQNFFLFWIQNWGFIFVGAILLFLSLVYKKIKTVFLQKSLPRFSVPEKIFLASLGVFFVANVIQFQGNPWDNIKIFLWILVLWVWTIFALFLKKNWQQVLFVLWCIPLGIFLLIPPFTQNRTQIFSAADRAIAQEFSQKIPSDSLVLTPDYHLFFVPTLTGNNIVMGYRGWLGSYGIDYSKRWREIKHIYEGRKNAKKLLNQYKIDVVVIDERLLPQHFDVNKEFFRENFPVILRKDAVEVYKIR